MVQNVFLLTLIQEEEFPLRNITFVTLINRFVFSSLTTPIPISQEL